MTLSTFSSNWKNYDFLNKSKTKTYSNIKTNDLTKTRTDFKTFWNW